MMPKRLKRGDAIEVRWRDHNSAGGWKYDSDVHADLIQIRSVGMFCKRTRATLVIMQSVDNETPSKSTDHIVIGLADVVSVRKLR